MAIQSGFLLTESHLRMCRFNRILLQDGAGQDLACIDLRPLAHRLRSAVEVTPQVEGKLGSYTGILSNLILNIHSNFYVMG